MSSYNFKKTQTHGHERAGGSFQLLKSSRLLTIVFGGKVGQLQSHTFAIVNVNLLMVVAVLFSRVAAQSFIAA